MPNEFVGMQKIPRLFRDIVITEKIDGTNACIFIADDLAPITYNSGRIVPFLCGSRTRWIQPENDNHGFAKWAYENAEELLKLGPGRHFGEWWGLGIQRNYGMKEKHFSLINVARWRENPERPACCDVVPVLYEGLFSEEMIKEVLNNLHVAGSVASCGFKPAEGIVIYHKQGNLSFKVTIEKDDEHKNARTLAPREREEKRGSAVEEIAGVV